MARLRATTEAVDLDRACFEQGSLAKSGSTIRYVGAMERRRSLAFVKGLSLRRNASPAQTRKQAVPSSQVTTKRRTATAAHYCTPQQPKTHKWIPHPQPLLGIPIRPEPPRPWHTVTSEPLALWRGASRAEMCWSRSRESARARAPRQADVLRVYVRGVVMKEVMAMPDPLALPASSPDIPRFGGDGESRFEVRVFPAGTVDLEVERCRLLCLSVGEGRWVASSTPVSCQIDLARPPRYGPRLNPRSSAERPQIFARNWASGLGYGRSSIFRLRFRRWGRFRGRAPIWLSSAGLASQLWSSSSRHWHKYGRARPDIVEYVGLESRATSTSACLERARASPREESLLSKVAVSGGSR